MGRKTLGGSLKSWLRWELLLGGRINLPQPPEFEFAVFGK
jgi:hypothetical protein